jgi:hypothetical protein
LSVTVGGRRNAKTKHQLRYRREISPEERLAIYLKYVLQISVRDKKGILDTIGVTLALN